MGKTSLGLVAAELLRAANVLSAWATCDASDDFSSVWRTALGEVGVATAKRTIGFREPGDETTEPLSKLLGPVTVTPHAVHAFSSVVKRCDFAADSKTVLPVCVRVPPELIFGGASLKIGPFCTRHAALYVGYA